MRFLIWAKRPKRKGIVNFPGTNDLKILEIEAEGPLGARQKIRQLGFTDIRYTKEMGDGEDGGVEVQKVSSIE